MKRGRGVRLICQLIIIFAVVSIFFAVAYAVYYLTRDPGTADSDLMDSLQELSHFFELQGENRPPDDEQGAGESLPADDMHTTDQEAIEGTESSVIEGTESSGAEGTISTGVGNFNIMEQCGNEAGGAQWQGESEESNASNEPNESDPPQGNDSSSEENESNVSESEERVRDMVNALLLFPKMPEREDLKAVLDGLMPQILEGCEDTYEQVKACYDYLIEMCEYSQTVKYTYEYDAYLLLTEFRGSCTYYVAALHYMLLYIGVENSITNGYRYPHPDISDRSSFHRWIEIKLNGVTYVLDPQWEDTLSHDGGLSYKRFFYTHEELKDYYMF